jgi:DNA-binding transcriptional ArsR family regulator
MTAAETFAPLMGDVAAEIFGKPDHKSGNGSTLRWRTRGSLKIDLEEGTWFDHEAKEGGGVLDLVMREVGRDKAGALEWMEDKGILKPRERGEPERYLYRDATGNVLYAKARVDKPDRKYEYQHPVGDKWRAGRGKIGAVPYRLPELLAAPRDAVLYMAEGEKKADKLASWDLLATSHKDWRADYAEHVTGRTVVILPDNDQGGEEQAADAARLVKAAGGKPVMVRLPDLPPKGDIMDWRGTRAGLAALVSLALAAPPERTGLAFRKGISARALMAKQFAPIKWIVPGYVTEGMYVLAGAPKLGKSWLALNWLVAVSNGGTAMGSIECEQGDVLGLMLEDNDRRLQRRLKQMRLMQLPERLTLLTEWPTIDDGCLEEIEAWIAGVENPRLVVVDVFARVKGSKTGKETDYDFDYRQAAFLQAIASRHGLAVIVIHHTRKMAADDPFDEVSGTRGLTGAADGVLVLKKDSGSQQPVLYGRGRDLEEVETALQFDKDTGTWSILGAAWLVADTHERREIQQVLGRSVDPMTPTEIADRIGKTRQNVQKMLSKMEDEGQVERIKRGSYVLVSMVSYNASVSTKETKETTPLHARECGQ